MSISFRLVFGLCVLLAFEVHAAKSSNQVPAKKSRAIKTAEQAPGFQILLYPLNQGRYSERAQDQNLTLRTPENYAFGARYGRFSSYIESSHFDEATGQGNLNIERRRKSHLLWTNYDVYQIADLLYFPVGLGMGVYHETVVTKIDTQEDRAAGEYQWNSGLSAALELRYKFLSLKTEGQLLHANNQNPNPSWAAFVRLGFVFGVPAPVSGR